MKNLYLIVTLVLLSITSGFASTVVENKKIATFFENQKINGTMVIYDVHNDTFTIYNKERASKQYPPASTFKIYNSLIGLQEGVIKNVDEVFYKYDNSPVYLESWAKDSNLRYAIKVSLLPAFEELARKIGLTKMQANINKLKFGNQNIGTKVDNFWVTGPLLISALEQSKILAELGEKKLPYNLEAQEQVADITKLDQGKNWVLHGKTGWTTANFNMGWFVGWVEQDGKIYSFALNMDIPLKEDLPLRQEIAIKSLKEFGLMQ